MAINKILIPVVGFENAGKSTVIDALLQGEYTQTSVLVCTKAIYRFPIDADNTTESSGFKTVSEINREVQSNNDHAESNKSPLTFPIKLRSSLCQNMMENTQLEIIDVPGWKESSVSPSPDKSQCTARHFITKNWDTFGLVLAVLDLTCTNEEARARNVELLQSLRQMNKGRGIPILILGNKADAIEDDGVKAAIDLMKADIQKSLDLVVQGENFIALSAKRALYYRYAMGLAYEDFASCYSTEKINQIGKSIYTEIGWERKKPSSRCRELLDDLQNHTIHANVMSEKGSNFGSLLKEIDVKVGGADNQRAVLKRGLELKLEQSSLRQNKHASWLDGIISVSRSLQSIGVSDQQKPVCRFWDLYDKFLSKAFSSFKVCVDFKTLVQATGAILEEFRSKIKLYMTPDEYEKLNKKIAESTRSTAQRYLMVIMKNFNVFVKSPATSNDVKTPVCSPKYQIAPETTRESTRSASKRRRIINLTTHDDPITWGELTAFDWKRILRALAQEVPSFHYHFPAIGKFVDDSLQSFGEGWGLSLDAIKEMEQCTKGTYDAKSCKFIPKDTEKYAVYAKLNMGNNDANSSDPEHWGHIPWLATNRC